MPVKPIDTLMAIKVLSFAPGLTANARAVGAVIFDRYNRKTGRCDPGIDGIARHLGIHERTVIRSTNRLVSVGLIRRLRHGGHGNRNQYEPVWERIWELEAQWRARLRQGRSRANSELSSSPGQDCHLGGDSPATQTYSPNLKPNERYLGGRPKEEGGRTFPSLRKMITPRSRDAAEAEAERRWTKALHDAFASKPLTYGEIVTAVTPDIQAAATSAELKRRGGGFAYIVAQLKLSGR